MTTPQPEPLTPEELANSGLDPEILSVLQFMMPGATGAPAGMLGDPGAFIQQAVMGSVFDVTGRAANPSAAGRELTRNLPVWVKDIEAQSPGLFRDMSDFVDPYFGTWENQADDMVYMGNRNRKVGAPESGPQGPVVDPIEAHAMGQRGLLETDTPPTDQERSIVRKYEELQANPPATPVATIGSDEYERLKQKIETWDSSHGGEPVEASAEGYSNRKDKVLNAAQVLNLPYTWDEEKILETMKLMRQSGINVTTFEGLVSTWGNLVNRASMIYGLSEGRNKVTPWDVLDMYKSEAAAAGSLTNYENGTRTTTSRSVASITEGEAWSSLQQTLANMLGRDPSDQEVRDFTYKMNQLAAANPAITKTITRYKAGEATSSSSSTEGGFAAADVAKAAYDKAQDDPEYAKVQSGTTYWNATLQALGAMGEV